MMLLCMYLLCSYTVLKKSQYTQNLYIRSSDLPYLVNVLRKNNIKPYQGLLEIIYDVIKKSPCINVLYKIYLP